MLQQHFKVCVALNNIEAAATYCLRMHDTLHREAAVAYTSGANDQLSACIASQIYATDGPETAEVPTTELWNRHYASCSQSPLNAVALAMPFWWRLMQCLKVYSVTKEQKNLWNALKYSTAFPLVYAGYIRRHRPSPRRRRAVPPR